MLSSVILYQTNQEQHLGQNSGNIQKKRRKKKANRDVLLVFVSSLGLAPH